ncbi:hypothetical protein EVAR_98966_1 [Eumeta japonica]|uniref:Uncharacterized protein n=1 Tax=Eumeta variegata TaxID=151549 RepID=A0A4C1YRA3_EUMVA|nr:hypothetical protein EVAR_98966_1 [Eumeta japonica]
MASIVFGRDRTGARLCISRHSYLESNGRCQLSRPRIGRAAVIYHAYTCPFIRDNIGLSNKRPTRHRPSVRPCLRCAFMIAAVEVLRTRRRIYDYSHPRPPSLAEQPLGSDVEGSELDPRYGGAFVIFFSACWL